MAYLTSQGGQPVLILKEGTARRRGKDAQRNNIMAARIISEVLRSTLGPRGMDKMLIDGLGDITITNDGAAILDEIEVEHPAAKMIVEVAKTQDDMVGDGTTTAVVLAGELLRRAEELLNQNIHPTVIVSGYRKASNTAIKTLNKIGITVDLKDRETLKKVASTAMASKAVGAARDHLADIAISAVKQVTERRGDKNVADIDQIQIIKKEGKSLFDTQLVNGMIIDKEIVHPGMSKRLKNAKIALLDCPLEIEKTEFSAEIRIKDPSQMKAFLDQENRMIREMVEKIKTSGANVVLCQKGIDDMAQHFLAKEGILAARRVKQSDMEKLARATGGSVITHIDDLKPKDLGKAGLVEERKVGEDKMIFVEDCKNPMSVAILIRAGLERMVDEAERAMNDALSVISDVIEHNKIVAGGGAIESEAENAGLESIDILVGLRAAHEKAKGHLMGVNVFTGKIVDMYANGVIEPESVKEQALKSAAEASSMILRIDDVIASTKPKEGGKPEPGGYGEEY